MNPFLTILLLAVAIYAFAAFLASRPRGRQLTPLCNVGEGFQPSHKTFYADAVFGSRYLLVKTGSDATHIALTGVGDIPKGITTDVPDAIGDGVNVNLLGLQERGQVGVASGAIAQDDLLVPGANGTMRTLPVAAGSYYIIGRALKAAADTDTVELIPCFPILRVVP